VKPNNNSPTQNDVSADYSYAKQIQPKSNSVDKCSMAQDISAFAM